MSWVGVAVSVGSALYGGYQANKQANAAIKAGKDPLAKERKHYAGLLGDLIDDPSSFYSNPLYQSAFGQGTQAVVRGMASQGYAGSGNMATGLQQYGQTFGYNMLKDYEQFLAELAGFSNFQSRAQGLEAYSDATKQMQQYMGDLGTIWGKYGPKPAAPSGNTGGSSWGSYGSSPFGGGSWDMINAGNNSYDIGSELGG